MNCSGLMRSEGFPAMEWSTSPGRIPDLAAQLSGVTLITFKGAGGSFLKCMPSRYNWSSLGAQNSVRPQSKILRTPWDSVCGKDSSGSGSHTLDRRLATSGSAPKGSGSHSLERRLAPSESAPKETRRRGRPEGASPEETLPASEERGVRGAFEATRGGAVEGSGVRKVPADLERGTSR